MANTIYTAPGSAPVQFSNTATTMLSVLYARQPSKMRAAMAHIQQDIGDPSKVHKLVGHDGVFVARGHGMRIVFRRGEGPSIVTSVAADI